ncbi:UNVERIFIED_CONTAM: hypothetical protein Scaly_1893600 [Sesamum calycinum]|uniref:Reverse transcriptase domain-containing protein n=1 Tax=Sesamum calycinum TaxID=2727403 RepID=A0AAW2NHS9_9LAMI
MTHDGEPLQNEEEIVGELVRWYAKLLGEAHRTQHLDLRPFYPFLMGTLMSGNSLRTTAYSSRLTPLFQKGNTLRLSTYRVLQVVNKIIFKVFINRSQPIMISLVAPSHNTFRPRGKISDNVLLAHELFYGYNENFYSERYVMKINIRKVYHTIDWNFLQGVLEVKNSPLVGIR